MDARSLTSDQRSGTSSARLARRVHRTLLRAQRGPLRPLWRWSYAGATRACSAYLRAAERGSAAYVGGSLGGGGPVYGLSDLDIAVVVPGDAGEPGAASARVRRRWERLTSVLPFVTAVVDCCVYEDAHLREAQAESTITHPGALYHGPVTDSDRHRLLERPELYGPTASWRRVAGPDRVPADPARDAQRRRIAAWLELQFLWRLAVELCLNPGRPGAASMCAKLVAEPARISLWLSEGRRTGGREDTLTQAISHLPDEAPALERALALQRSLASSPEPPLADSLEVFRRLSSRIAAQIEGELEGGGATEVRLSRGELALPHGRWDPPQRWASGSAPPLFPLADWRAMTHPTLPDETFAPVAGDPGDPDRLASAALLMRKGPYATLAADGLLVRPFHGGRARLRAVQCRVTDPVSFALLAGVETARFSDVTGWSARDTARRAVAEHAAWLAAHTLPGMPSIQYLGILLTAARAALLHESIDAQQPELALTASATAAALAERVPGARGTADAVGEEYAERAVDWLPPARPVVAALDEVVRGLTPYAR